MLSGIAGSYSTPILVFLRNLHTLLHSGYIYLHSHQQCKTVPFLHKKLYNCHIVENQSLEDTVTLSDRDCLASTFCRFCLLLLQFSDAGLMYFLYKPKALSDVSSVAE